MKVCIFGADGRTGVEVVTYAKAQGFEVVAFVYSDASDMFFPKDIVIKKGTVMDYVSVFEALKGSDAVISVLGHIKGSDPLMQTKGMINIVRAMKDLGMKRILSLTGTGVRIPNDSPSIIDMFLNFVIKTIDPIRIQDGIKHAKVLQESGLDFTIVRVLKLNTSNTESKAYTLTEDGPAELQTSRKKVARVLVDLIHDAKYLHKFPVISG